jgi:hypothetical protein
MGRKPHFSAFYSTKTMKHAIILALALTAGAAHAQTTDWDQKLSDAGVPAPLTAVQQQRSMQYLDDMQYKHAQQQVQQAIDYQNCMFNKRYGYSNKDCD